MPKDKRSRSISFDHSRPSPLPSSSKNPRKSPRPADSDSLQWDEIRCPVCMEHPHNAVLLLCTSHDKGCRPFICDTSYRHSNCLDQYRKAIKASMPADSKTILSCPLCRGAVSGSRVVQAARKHMNTKGRCCSTESCGFFGPYCDLRKHARSDHPLVRPAEADPEREREWRRLEQERDLGDLFSTMQSALGGEEEGFTFLADGGGEFGGLFPLPTITFFLVLRFRGARGVGSGAGWSNGRRGLGRSSRAWRRRGRVLWGESIVDAEGGGRDRSDGDDVDDDYDRFDDEGDEDDGNDDDGGGDDDSIASRQHQRRTRRQLRMVDDDANGTDNTR